MEFAFSLDVQHPSPLQPPDITQHQQQQQQQHQHQQHQLQQHQPSTTPKDPSVHSVPQRRTSNFRPQPLKVDSHLLLKPEDRAELTALVERRGPGVVELVFDPNTNQADTFLFQHGLHLSKNDAGCKWGTRTSNPTRIVKQCLCGSFQGAHHRNKLAKPSQSRYQYVGCLAFVILTYRYSKLIGAAGYLNHSDACGNAQPRSLSTTYESKKDYAVKRKQIAELATATSTLLKGLYTATHSLQKLKPQQRPNRTKPTAYLSLTTNLEALLASPQYAQALRDTEAILAKKPIAFDSERQQQNQQHQGEEITQGGEIGSAAVPAEVQMHDVPI